MVGPMEEDIGPWLGGGGEEESIEVARVGVTMNPVVILGKVRSTAPALRNENRREEDKAIGEDYVLSVCREGGEKGNEESGDSNRM